MRWDTENRVRATSAPKFRGEDVIDEKRCHFFSRAETCPGIPNRGMAKCISCECFYPDQYRSPSLTAFKVIPKKGDVDMAKAKVAEDILNHTWDSKTNREFVKNYLIESAVGPLIYHKKTMPFPIRWTTGVEGPKEVDMTERMTRKELTEKVNHLQMVNEKYGENFLKIEKRLVELEDTCVTFKRFEALVEFLNLESEYVYSTDGHYKFRRKRAKRKKQAKEKK